MIFLFILILLIIIVLYILSKNKYNEYIEPLDKKEYRLKDWLPMGFYVMNKLKYTYSTAYDRKLLNKIAELKVRGIPCIICKCIGPIKTVLLLLIYTLCWLWLGLLWDTVDVSLPYLQCLYLVRLLFFR
jgi:tight adherence protein C